MSCKSEEEGGRTPDNSSIYVDDRQLGREGSCAEGFRGAVRLREGEVGLEDRDARASSDCQGVLSSDALFVKRIAGFGQSLRQYPKAQIERAITDLHLVLPRRRPKFEPLVAVVVDALSNNEKVRAVASLDEPVLVEHQSLVGAHDVGLNAGLDVGRLAVVVPHLVLDVRRPSADVDRHEAQSAVADCRLRLFDLGDDDNERSLVGLHRSQAEVNGRPRRDE